jgi:hypothetical protein
MREQVPLPSDPGDEKFEVASSRLHDGLRSCRAVVSNYRALLVADGEEDGGQVGVAETSDASESAAS